MFGRDAFVAKVAIQLVNLFEAADQGTIFFDEIGTIGPETQAKLLRVIQEREFTPLGSNEVVKVDVRILAATKVCEHQAGGMRFGPSVVSPTPAVAPATCA